MNEEAAFFAAINENPGDSTTRLVFADWLDDRGDPRGAGFRAIVRLGIVPVKSVSKDRSDGYVWYVWNVAKYTSYKWRKPLPGNSYSCAMLPKRWFLLLEGFTESDDSSNEGGSWWRAWDSLAEAQSAIAKAYRPEFEKDKK